MYQFIDSPTASLDTGAQIFIWCARRWLKGAREKRCVCAPIDNAFRTYSMPDAIDHFHIGMRALYHNPLVPLYFGCMERKSVTEHEAILLGVLLSSLDGKDHEVKAICRGLVQADMAPVLARSLGFVASQFDQAGLSFVSGVKEIARQSGAESKPQVHSLMRARLEILKRALRLRQS